MTEQEDKLTPGRFSPPEQDGTGNRLTATTFEPLSEAIVKRASVSPAQVALGITGVVIAGERETAPATSGASVPCKTIWL